MRINAQYTPQSPAEADRRLGVQNANSSSASRLQAGQDETQLSPAHAQIEALAGQAAQLPEVREERVQSLRELVRSGAYLPDPQKVAGAMLAHMIAGPAA